MISIRGFIRYVHATNTTGHSGYISQVLRGEIRITHVHITNNELIKYITHILANTSVVT